MSTVRIPQYVDSPPQIMFWEADEVAPSVVLVGLGIMTGTLSYMILLAYAVHKINIHYKSKRMRGHLLHFLFRIGLIPLNPRFSNGSVTYWHV